MIRYRQMRAEEDPGSTRTEASLVTILRLAKAKKHLWTLAWFSCGRRTRSLAVHGRWPRSGEGRLDDCSPLYAFSGLSIKASITISIWVRSVCVACEEWKQLVTGSERGSPLPTWSDPRNSRGSELTTFSISSWFFYQDQKTRNWRK